MSKPDFSVTVRLTPRQAALIVAALRYWERTREPSSRLRSVLNGAESRVRNALIDQGWTEDGRWWTRDE